MRILIILSLLLAFLATACSSGKEVKPAPVDPEVSLHKAQDLIEKGKYDEARQLLTEAKGSDTTKKFAPLAQLKIADSYEKEGDFETAASEYKKFIEQFPDSQYATFAQYQAAMSYYSMVKGPEKGTGSAKRALDEFQRLKLLYPRNPYKDDVENKITDTRNIIADYEFLIGKFYYKKDSYKAALGRFLGLVRNFPDYKSLEEVYYYITISYQKTGSVPDAETYFDKLRSSFPQSRYLGQLSKQLPPEKTIR